MWVVSERRSDREQATLAVTALERCRAIEVWWVHPSVAGSRDDAAALGVAELGRLAAIAADGTTFHDGYDVIARLRRELP